MSERRSLQRSDGPAHALRIGRPSRLISRGLEILQASENQIRPLAPDKPPVFRLAWGGQGIGLGEFSVPQGVTQSPDGLVYVADSKHHRIQVFSEMGVVRKVWGTNGAAPGQFSRPQDVGVDPWGRIVVADSHNHRIQVFTGDGRFVTEWPCHRPTAIAVDGEGCVYAATDTSTDLRGEREDARGLTGVRKFSPHGEMLKRWIPYQLPGEDWDRDDQRDFTNIAVGPHGEIYVGLSSNLWLAGEWTHWIQRWDANGSVTEELDIDVLPPWRLATDGDGYLYVASGYGIQKFSCHGQLLWELPCDIPDSLRDVMLDEIGLPQLDDVGLPEAVFVNDARELFVADTHNHMILKFGPERWPGS